MSFIQKIFSVFMLVVVSAPAVAHVFEWGDPDSQVVFQVPDSWRMMQPEDAADVVRFRAPGPNQHAECRMRIEDDNRYNIYPERLSDHAHDVRIDDGFWEGFAKKDYKEHYINDVRGAMALGNGYATRADISYVPMNKNIAMRGLSWATHYADKLYVLSCSSQFDSFDAWNPSFQNILSTVKMPEKFHGLPSGHYRYFVGDDVLHITAPNGQSSDH